MKKLALCFLLIAPSAFAQMGADVLLQSTGTDEAADRSQLPTASQFKLNDAYLQTLLVEWKSQGNQSFEVNRWFTQILSGNTTQAAHMWSTMQEHFPENVRPIAKATWVYLTWKMNLPQTFLEAYKTTRNDTQIPERLKIALDQVISAEAGSSWFVANKPYMHQSYADAVLLNTQPVGFDLEMAAWAARYDLNHAARILTLLPMGHPLSLELASTAVLNFSRKNEIGEAGKLLKRRVEPELELRKDPKALSRHYLTLGRLLYQAGALEASEAFYARIPRGVDDFIPARAERTWALLRMGRVGELRGELTSLSHKVFSDRFLPEVALVRSISNLKLCRYDDVAQDFAAFIEAHKTWANKIQVALENPEASKIDMEDKKITALENAIKERKLEEAQLAKLAIDSVKAALPAVGEQAHWTSALSQVTSAKAELSRQVVAQKQRFWKNREIVLTEAIRKMKFVRVEAMAQVRMATVAQANNDVTDTIKRVQSAPSKGSQTYPFEGVYWPDELFKMHAQATSRCGGK
ncbi:MAG: hypothetical protein K2P81_12965 [Bacteriovoracaceae bacterium]|nr:hypothetical protein [Bacteriovoracaceae bacterium]